MQGKEVLSGPCAYMQLMAVIENVLPKFITLEEVDGFLFTHMKVDRKAGEDVKKKVSCTNISCDCCILAFLQWKGCLWLARLFSGLSTYRT